MDDERFTLGGMSKKVDNDFPSRLRKAAEENRIAYSQTAIAKFLKIYKQKVDQWMGGSLPTADQLFEVADKFGVDPRWFATGKGTMARHEPPASDTPIPSEDALQIAHAFDQMTPQTKERIREHVFLYAVMDKEWPWFRSGKPISNNYDAYEDWHKNNYRTQLNFEAARIAKVKK